MIDEKKLLPEWALKEENYTPANDRDIFISRSILRLTGILFALKKNSTKNFTKKFSAAAAFAFTFFFIILCVSSHTKEFLLIAATLELIILNFLDGAEILRILKKSFAAAFFGGILILPAFFFGAGNLIILLPIKTFLTMTALQLVTEFFLWNQITAAMKIFRLPDVVIFILDTTIKYIFLLGRQAQELLTALKLRSVGKNLSKEKSFSGVLGVTFLKSREMSEQMYQAMCCRCFTGEYFRAETKIFFAADLIFILLGGIFGGLFLIIEGVFK
ncbi:MAG: cobalt ABC transporter permease [Selenomonadaceae bacterium]|nr:cobalt ABC transporter permease [Selenomonadaceae bacterium]